VSAALFFLPSYAAALDAIAEEIRQAYIANSLSYRYGAENALSTP
jgi:hypothetical protein